MKRLFIFCLLSLLLPASVSAAELIRKYEVSATLTPDRLASFEETIEYDFGEADRHGIYRDIPVRYSRQGGNYQLRLKNIEVTRNGSKEQFETSTSNGELHLKIGNPDITITGPHTYQIRYQTDRAINDFANTQELYWNVVGTGWKVPIEMASFTLQAPTATFNSVSTTCFVGAYGSTESTCDVVPMARGSSSYRFAALRVLGPHEGFTIAYSAPRGTFRELTLTDKIWRILQDNGVLFFPLAALMIMFIQWWRLGRDPKLQAIIPEYEAPAGYAPAVLSAAATEGHVPDRAITATIIDLARRGYLHIRFGEEKGLLFGSTPTYTFVKTTKDPQDLQDFEKDLYEALFHGRDEVDLAKLKLDQTEFVKHTHAFRSHVQATVDAKKLFDDNPLKTRSAYIAVGFALGIGLSFVISDTTLGTASALTTGFIICVFGWFMPRRNKLGSDMLRRIKGFEWFMSVTEKDRLDFHNAPERTPEQFMSVLPFAIAFGLEKKWAQQFASLHLQPPQWAEGALAANFTSSNFASSLNGLESATAAISSAGSGGSGFSGGGSGGGGGGGGGGSW